MLLIYCGSRCWEKSTGEIERKHDVRSHRARRRAKLTHFFNAIINYHQLQQPPAGRGRALNCMFRSAPAVSVGSAPNLSVSRLRSQTFHDYQSGGIAVSPSLAAFSAQLGIFLIRIFLVVFILQFVVVLRLYFTSGQYATPQTARDVLGTSPPGDIQDVAVTSRCRTFSSVLKRPAFLNLLSSYFGP